MFWEINIIRHLSDCVYLTVCLNLFMPLHSFLLSSVSTFPPLGETKRLNC